MSWKTILVPHDSSGFAAIKGMGSQAAEAIVAARGSETFRDLSDFARRFDPKLVNKLLGQMGQNVRKMGSSNGISAGQQ